MTDAMILDGGEHSTLDDMDDVGEEASIQEYRMLEAGDQIYDMADETEARQLEDILQQKREELNERQLLQYEGKATQFGLGGRSELLYDQVRARLAVRFHEGKHDMNWEEQHEAAEKVVRIRAIQTRAQWSK
jgi:hypothetical protein